jgi:hypothetical protein
VPQRRIVIPPRTWVRIDLLLIAIDVIQEQAFMNARRATPRPAARRRPRRKMAATS